MGKVIELKGYYRLQSLIHACETKMSVRAT